MWKFFWKSQFRNIPRNVRTLAILKQTFQNRVHEIILFVKIWIISGVKQVWSIYLKNVIKIKIPNEVLLLVDIGKDTAFSSFFLLPLG